MNGNRPRHAAFFMLLLRRFLRVGNVFFYYMFFRGFGDIRHGREQAAYCLFIG